MARGKHEEVLETLRGKILRGEYAVRFPSERMLCKQFSVTRDAIRKVLAQLSPSVSSPVSAGREPISPNAPGTGRAESSASSCPT